MNTLIANYKTAQPELISIAIPDAMAEALVVILNDLLIKLNPTDPYLPEHYTKARNLMDKLNSVDTVLKEEDVLILSELLQIYQARCCIMIVAHDLKDRCESSGLCLEYNKLEPVTLYNSNHKTALHLVDTSILEAAVNIADKIRIALYPTLNYFKNYDGE